MKFIKNYLWSIPTFTLFIGIITFIFFSVLNQNFSLIIFLELIGASILSFLLPLMEKYLKIHFSIFLVSLICFHIILCVDLGTALDFYNKLYGWDLIVHGLFGFIASYIGYLILKKYFSIQNHPWITLLFFSSFCLAFGALWEIWEFSFSIILNEDIQRVQESIAMGKSPLFDTMWDIIITLIGSFAFDLCFVIDKKFKKFL